MKRLEALQVIRGRRQNLITNTQSRTMLSVEFRVILFSREIFVAREILLIFS